MMRLVTPYTLCLFVVLWTALFVILARYFLFSAHQTWFEAEETKLLNELTFKIDSLDTRNIRQLNQLYGEVKRVEDVLVDLNLCLKHGNCSQTAEENLPTQPVMVKRSVSPATLEPSIPILVITCNRQDYLTRTLESLLRYRPSAGLFPIVASQDCAHLPTTQAIEKYGNRVTHIKQPNQSEPVIPPDIKKKVKNSNSLKGYFKVSRHYKWALTQVFDEMGYDHVIIVEDDLEISPDFYSYFSALRTFLDSDPSLWCISAWNDNGKEGCVDKEKSDLLYRTEFFPGLGWMLTKSLWKELKPKWPEGFWDDWMREPEQRRDRSCIRPEVSRSKTFGEKGVSGGQYYKTHLKFTVLNQNPVDFYKKNLTYLMEDVYEKAYVQHVLAVPSVDLNEVLHGNRPDVTEVQLRYSDIKEFERYAKAVKIMYDLRGGVPRTAYKGIVSFMYRNRRVHLTPPQPWNGYTALT